MGVKRLFDTAFWHNPKIDTLTADEKYFWLYCLLNTHNSICGVACVGVKTIANEMGISIDKVNTLLDRFINKHKLIQYDPDEKEVLINNWNEYFWTTSQSLKENIIKQAKTIKTKSFLNHVISKIDGGDTVPPQSHEGSITQSLSQPILTNTDGSITTTKVDR